MFVAGLFLNRSPGWNGNKYNPSESRKNERTVKYHYFSKFMCTQKNGSAVCPVALYLTVYLTYIPPRSRHAPDSKIQNNNM